MGDIRSEDSTRGNPFIYGAYAEQFDKIWKIVAKTKGKEISFSPPDSLGDSPWSLGSLCHILEEGVRQRESVSVDVRDLGLVRSGQPYIPYGKKPPMVNGMSPIEAEAILNSILGNDHQACFTGTRIEATLKRIVRDFAAELLSGASVSERSFKFIGLPLKLKKGNEAALLRPHYVKMGVTSVDEFQQRVIRDFFISFYTFQFIRGYEANDLSISGSIMCLPTWIDYIGGADDAKVGRKAYEAAMMDALTMYGGHSYAMVCNDVVMTTAFMRYKQETESHYLRLVDVMPPETTRFPTPREFLEVRWWDAACSPFYRVPLTFSEKTGIPLDKRGAPLGTGICPAIRSTIEISISYSEAIDVNHDVECAESMNEVHVAARYGGLAAVVEYADACAAVVDLVSTCACAAGDIAHDWAMDMANGYVCWYTLVPRYRALTQLSETHAPTAARYRSLIEATNHAAFVTGKIAKIFPKSWTGALHDQNWVPIHTMTSIPPYTNGDCAHCECIGSWVVNRCVYRDMRDELGDAVRKFVKKRVHLEPSPAMKDFWGDLIELLAGNRFSSDITKCCSEAVNSMWETLRDASEGAEVVELADKGVEIYIMLNKLILKTNGVPGAHVLRRGMMGCISLMADRTDVALFQRVMDAALEYSKAANGTVGRNFPNIPNPPPAPPG